MLVFEQLPRIPKRKQKINYNLMKVKNIEDSLYMEIGGYKESRKNNSTKRELVKKNDMGISCKKELLEYELGIYRMFPTGKQFQYHMQFLHVPRVTERSIR